MKYKAVVIRTNKDETMLTQVGIGGVKNITKSLIGVSIYSETKNGNSEDVWPWTSIMNAVFVRAETELRK